MEFARLNSCAKGVAMSEKAFKQQVIDKLILLVKTPNFDKTYTVVPKRSFSHPEVVVWQNNKECFSIGIGGGAYHYYDTVIPDDKAYIKIYEYEGLFRDKLNPLYLKVHELSELLWGISKRKEAALQKERNQQDRLLVDKQKLAEKQKQDNILLGLDSIIKVSMGYSK